MSTSYPKVHVVGSGAYYSYRPITRFIEKVERNHYRDNSSRPKEFGSYVGALNSRGDGYRRAPSTVSDYGRGSSLPPERKRASAFDEDSFFNRGGEELFSRRGADDIISRRRGGGGDDSFLRREDESLSKRKGRYSSYLQQQEEDSTVVESDRKALFGTSSGEDSLSRLRRKHPYRLAVENETVPPHESSIWPENRPHFDLVSSYDTMVDYLGIRDKSKK